MVTMKDVADYAGVSTATISRALMNPDMVSVKTRELVQAAVLATGYDVRLSSRIKNRHHAHIILTVASDLSDVFFNEIIAGIESEAKKNGYLVFVCSGDDISIRQNIISNFIMNKQIAGIILLDEKIPINLTKYKEDAFPPMVMICEHASGIEIPMLHADNLTSAYYAVNYLLKNGHKRIATITGPQKNGLSSYRLKGYEQALQRSGIEQNPDYIIAGDYSFASGKSATMELLQLRTPPTAIFCHNDLMAIGAMHSVKSMGLKVPENISIIGFDGLEVGTYVIPRLTTIEQPRFDFGKKAVELIVDAVQTGKPIPSSTLMESRWIKGGTVFNLNKIHL